MKEMAPKEWCKQEVADALREGYRAGVAACIARLEREALLAKQGARMHWLACAAEELRGMEGPDG